MLYVDGKTGNDANSGLEPTKALKTIARAANMLPAGSRAAGWTVSVKGYSDYVYRERPVPPGWDRSGTAAAPVTFQATDYSPGFASTYVKPVVSGAEIAPAAGQSWVGSGLRGVWQTPWTNAPLGFGGPTSTVQNALFQDGTSWLWEQGSLAALEERAQVGKGGYWYDGDAQMLYASAIGAPTSGANDPSRYHIEVVMRKTFLFMGTEGVAHVSVRGFDVRNSANGIAFLAGADYGVVADNIVTGNIMMGIETAGGQSPAGPDPASGHIVIRNTGSYNTIQMIKVDAGTESSRFCDNTASRNRLQGIKVQGPPSGSLYIGSTSGVTICRNTLTANNYNPTGADFNNTSGLTIANGAQQVAVTGNHIYGNEVGIHITQESAGRRSMNGIVLRGNDVHDNRRFGLNLYDGAYGPAYGSGTLLSENDLYWGNGIGIMASPGTVNKVISHATIYGNVTDGVRVGGGNHPASRVVLSRSVVSANRGYGLWVESNNSLTATSVNLHSNARGNTKGKLTLRAVNTRLPGFITTKPRNADFLRISRKSYQYTAGPSKSPIGARY